MYAQLYAQSYDGNNYVMTQTDVMWWVWFLIIVIVLTFGLLCLYLLATYRACETTKDDDHHRFATPEELEASKAASTPPAEERELAHAGSGPDGAEG